MSKPSKLFTKPILKRLQSQYAPGEINLKTMKVICKIFHPLAEVEYYILFQDPNDLDHLKAIIKDSDIDVGDLSLKKVEDTIFYNYPLEREYYFEPTPAEHVWDKLSKGEPV
jgi:hypothetical protein